MILCIEPTEMEDSFEPFHEWVNLNSFVARLFAHGLIDWYRYGIWTMMGSLEANDTTVKDLRESRVAAATQWIAHGALALFTVMRDKEATEVDQTYLKSTIFSGDKVISFERWTFWRDQLQKLEEKDISPKGRHMASQAVIAMSDAEAQWGQG